MNPISRVPKLNQAQILPKTKFLQKYLADLNALEDASFSLSTGWWSNTSFGDHIIWLLGTMDL